MNEKIISKYSNIPFLSEVYNSAVTELLQKLRASWTLSEIRFLFSEFSNKFTVIPQLWRIWLDFEENYNEADIEQSYKDKIKLDAESHFNFDQNPLDTNSLRKKGKSVKYKFFNNFEKCPQLSWLLWSSDFQQLCEELLTYPQRRLEEAFNIWKKFSARPLSPSALKKHEEAKLVANEIIAAGDNLEKWFKGLMKWNDDQFIRDNIELKLGEDPGNREIWKLYLDFFKKKSDVHILNVYSRFCRIFIEDDEMRKEYQYEIKKRGELSIDVSKWWIDSIEFERIFGCIPMACLITEVALKNCGSEGMHAFVTEFVRQYECKKMNDIYISKYMDKIKFYTQSNEESQIAKTPKSSKNVSGFGEGVIRQSFNFPYNFMNYIFDNGSFELRHRFYESCKHFFIKGNKKLLCHYLIVGGFPEYVFQSLMIFEYKKCENIIVTNYFEVSDIDITTQQLLQHIQVKAKYLVLLGQKLTSKELSLLISPRLEEASFEDIVVTDFMNSPLEKLVELFLNIFSLKIARIPCFPDTVKNLSQLESTTKKIKHFSLDGISNSFNVNFFSTFLMNNCDMNAKIEICFEAGVSDDFKTIFNTTLENILKTSLIRVSMIEWVDLFPKFSFS